MHLLQVTILLHKVELGKTITNYNAMKVLTNVDNYYVVVAQKEAILYGVSTKQADC